MKKSQQQPTTKGMKRKERKAKKKSEESSRNWNWNWCLCECWRQQKKTHKKAPTASVSQHPSLLATLIFLVQNTVNLKRKKTHTEWKAHSTKFFYVKIIFHLTFLLNNIQHRKEKENKKGKKKLLFIGVGGCCWLTGWLVSWILRNNAMVCHDGCPLNEL